MLYVLVVYKDDSKDFVPSLNRIGILWKVSLIPVNSISIKFSINLQSWINPTCIYVNPIGKGSVTSVKSLKSFGETEDYDFSIDNESTFQTEISVETELSLSKEKGVSWLCVRNSIILINLANIL